MLPFSDLFLHLFYKIFKISLTFLFFHSNFNIKMQRHVNEIELNHRNDPTLSCFSFIWSKTSIALSSLYCLFDLHSWWKIFWNQKYRSSFLFISFKLISSSFQVNINCSKCECSKLRHLNRFSFTELCLNIWAKCIPNCFFFFLII